MRKRMLLALCILLSLCLIQMGAAYDAKSITVNPSGGANPGEDVNAHGDIKFSRTPEVFDPAHSLRFSTDLTKANWLFKIIDIETKQPKTEFKRTGSSTTITGWELAYPSDSPIYLEVTLEGIAPNASSTPTRTVMKIEELDSSGQLVTGGEFKKEVEVYNPAGISTLLSQREKELADLRTSIDEKIRLGVDVSSVESKYSEAEKAIDDAKNSPSNYAVAQASLTKAKTSIDEANANLDKVWAQFELDQANQKISNVNGMINYFKVNRSMGSDPRVVEIVSKYESASQSYSSSKTMFEQGNYPQARILANETMNKALEAETLCTRLKADIGEGFSMGGMLPMILGIVVVAVLLAVGYVVYKKKTKWDELG